MPLTIQVFSPSGETEATLTAITGTGTAANPYTITQQGSSQFGTIEVADAIDPADDLLGLWQWKVGTRAVGRVLIVAGQTDYPIQSSQQAAAAAITAAGLATEATLDDIKGATFDASTDSLEAIRDRGDAAWVTGGGGGGGTVNVLPAVGIVADRSPGVTLQPVVGETISQSITLYATDGTTPINLSGKTLVAVFETLQGVDVSTVPNSSISVSGDSNNVVTFSYPSVVTSAERTLRFALRDAGAPLAMYLQGLCVVTQAPQVDV
jgi:hypothetical protein